MNFEEIKNKTFGKRVPFTRSEIAGVIDFCEHMRNIGHKYIVHPDIAEKLESFANEGFVAIYTEPPVLGVLYVKVLHKKSFLGKKYKYHMYITKEANLNELKKQQYEYPNFFKSLPNISLFRDGMKF